MSQAESWITLVLGVVVGLVIGWAATWRMARKLEHHGVRLKAWDEAEYQSVHLTAVERLRGVGR